MVRRGGGNAAGAEKPAEEVAAVDTSVKLGGQLVGPPLKRVQPWVLANTCDITIGSVDVTGNFSGAVISDATLVALLRCLQLAPSRMPAHIRSALPSPLNQAISDGCPMIVVTRSVFGRELDPFHGPMRNESQAHIWAACRSSRAEMPSVHITCVDVPVHATADQISTCLQPPMCNYRELAYYNGTWYVPEMKDASHLRKQMKENEKKPLFGPGPPRGSEPKVDGAGKFEFQRKRFDWRDTSGANEQSLWMMTWTSVGTIDPSLAREPDLSDEVPSNIKAATAEILKSRPANTRLTQQGVRLSLSAGSGIDVDKDGQELLAIAKDRLTKALLADEGIDKAMAAGNLALSRFKEDEDKKLEAEALYVVVRCALAGSGPETSLSLASELQSLYQELADAEGEIEAVRMVISAHVAKRDDNAAVQSATDLRAQFQAKGDKKREAEAVKLLVSTQLAAGFAQPALSSANEAREYFKKAGDKQGEAVACLAEASVHSFRSAHQEALLAQTAARTLYSELKDKRAEADALKAACLTLFLMSSLQEAEKSAKDMSELFRAVGDKAGEATALQFATIAGGDKRSATQAVDIFDELQDKEAAAVAKYAIARAYLAIQDTDAALQAGKEAVVLFKASGAPGLAAAFLGCARANFAKGHMHSAMWDAKQALRCSVLRMDTEGQKLAATMMSSIQQASDKGFTMGPPIPIFHAGNKASVSAVEFM